MRKTIQKRRAKQRQSTSQHTTASQRKAALQSVLRATSKGPAINQPKKPRTTYQQTSNGQGSRQTLLALTTTKANSPLLAIDLSESALPADRPTHEPRAQLTDLQMSQSEGPTQHLVEQHNYQHHSGRKADGRQDNNGDRQHPQAQQLPVPPAPDRAEEITAAEDVDMQIEQHSDDQTEPKGHSTPTSTRAAALPGGSYAPKRTEPKNQPNDQHTEQEEPQPTQPLYQYGLISLFDGCASTHDLIAEAAGTAPTIFILPRTTQKSDSTSEPGTNGTSTENGSAKAPHTTATLPTLTSSSTTREQSSSKH